MPKSNTVGQNRCAMERMVLTVAELASGHPLKQIAATLEVAPKTVMRDLNFLRDRMGLQASFDSKTNRWQIQNAEPFQALRDMLTIY